MKQQKTNLDPNRRRRYLLIGTVVLAIVILSVATWKLTGEESSLVALAMDLTHNLM